MTWMTWQERLEQLNQANQYATPGLSLDLATAPWNYAAPNATPPTLNGPNQPMQEIAPGVPVPPALQQGQAINAANAVANVPNDWGPIGDAIGLGGDALAALVVPYRWVSTNLFSPLVHMPLTMMSDDFIAKNAGKDPFEIVRNAWNYSSEWAEKDSVGRGVTTLAFALGSGKAWDNLTPEEIEEIQSGDGWFQGISGYNDLMSNIFLDPLVVAGKVGKVSRLFRYTDHVETLMNPTLGERILERGKMGVDSMIPGRKEDLARFKEFRADRSPENLVKLDRVQDFLKWSDGKSPKEIAEHPAIKANPNSGLVAAVLSESSSSQKELMYRIGVGDRLAFREMAEENPRVAAMFGRLRADHNEAALAMAVLSDAGFLGDNAWAVSEEAVKRAEMLGYRSDNYANLKLFGDGKSPGTEFDPNKAPPVSPFTPGYGPDAVNAAYWQVPRPTPGPFPLDYAEADKLHIRNSFNTFRLREEADLFTPAGDRMTPAYAQAIHQRMEEYQQLMKVLTADHPSYLPAPTFRPSTAQELVTVRKADVPESMAKRGTVAKEWTEGWRKLQAEGSGWRYDLSGTPSYRHLSMDDAYGTHNGPMSGQTDLFGNEWIPGRVAEEKAHIAATRDRKVSNRYGTGRPGDRATMDQALDRDIERSKGTVENLKESRRMTRRPDRGTPEQADWYRAQVHLERQSYDPGVQAIDDAAERLQGQLSLIDDLVGPELQAYNAHANWITSAVKYADDLGHIPTDAGLFRAIEIIPKGGLKGRAANAKANRARSRDLNYVRGGTRAEEAARKGDRQNDLHTFEGLTYTPPTRSYDGPLGRVYNVLGPMHARVTEKFLDAGTPLLYNPNDLEAWRGLDGWLKSVSGLPSEMRAKWVGEHMALTDAAGKLAHIEQVEANVLAHTINRVGGVSPVMTRVLSQKTLYHRKAMLGHVLRGENPNMMPGAAHGSADAVFAAGNSGARPDLLDLDGTVHVASPLLRDQLANNHVFLPIRDLERSLWEDRHILRGPLSGLDNGLTDLALSFTNTSNKIWKATVLFRPGYVARTLSDEMLVAMATIGTWTYMGQGVRAARNKAVNRLSGSTGARKAYRRAHGKKPLLPYKGPDVELANKLGKGPVDVGLGPYSAIGIYDGPRADVMRALTGTDQSALYETYGRTLDGLRKRSGWGVLDRANELDHVPSWNHALNNVFARDEFGRMALAGATVKEMTHFLSTPAGLRYAAGHQLLKRHEKEWAARVHQMVSDYTLDNPMLRQAALDHNVTDDMLKQFPVDKRPQVHGGEIDWTLGTMSDFVDRAISNFYRIANEMPTNALVRHPVADVLYRQKLTEMVGSARAQGFDPALNPEEIYHMEEIARRHVINKMGNIFKDNLFSSPTGALRFISPFFGAWRGSIARWARLVGEDPSSVARLNQGWQGLHKGFDLVDEDGNPIDSETPQGLNSKARIVLRMPMSMAKHLGLQDVSPSKQIPLKSFNTWLSGDPWYNAGAGPFVTVPVSEWLMHDPLPEAWRRNELKAASPILPFGPRTLRQNTLPAILTNLGNLNADNDEVSKAGRVKNIWNIEDTNWRLGIGPKPSMARARQKERNLSWLNAITKFISPVTMQDQFYDKRWERPIPVTDPVTGKVTGYRQLPKGWQYLAGKLRDYRENTPGPDGKPDYNAGTERFLAEFPEAFSFMDATSKNVGGISADVEDYNASMKVKQWGNKAPLIFAAVAGIQDTDRDAAEKYGYIAKEFKFDKYAYMAQKMTTFNENTGEKFREVRVGEDFMRETMVNQGWRDWSKLQDILTSMVAGANYSSIEDPRAQWIKDMKASMVQQLGAKNTYWYNDYVVPNPQMQMDRMEQMRLVVDDKQLSKRTDVQGLAQYLGVRDFVAIQLQDRKAANRDHTLTAEDNQDLMDFWENYRQQAVGNTEFAAIWFNRYFANDMLQEVR